MTRVNGPSVEQHRDWIARATDLASFIAPKGKWPEWVITSRFYAALHEIQALLTEQHIVLGGGHLERNAYVERHWPGVYDPYSRLYRWSRDARSNCYAPEVRLNDSTLLLVKVRAALDERRSYFANPS